MELVQWWVVLVLLNSQAELPDSWLVGHLARGEVPELLHSLINRLVSLVI
jgi:hypothetical protein